MKKYLYSIIAVVLIASVFVWFNQAWASTLIASYTASLTTSGSIGNGSGRGMTFNNPTSITLDSADFTLTNSFSATGHVQVAIYNVTGVYGSTEVPTGDPLAYSNVIDVTTIPTSYTLTTFTFSGANRITLSASTDYGLAVIATGTMTNNINIGAHTTPTYPGNAITLSSGLWFYSVAYGNVFHVYGTSSGGGTVAVSGSGQKMLMSMTY